METYEEEERAPSNILAAVMRYKLHLLAAVSALMVVAVGVVLAIPPVYRSTGTIMVETQQIPTNFVQSTVTSAAAEQIDIITQRVMTREKIMGIIESHHLFDFENASLIEQSNQLDDFRNNVTIEVTSANSGRESVAIGFSVSFDSESPSVARVVATELVELYLSENVKARTQRASETTDFLKSEAEKMRSQLETIERQVAEFKRTNKDSLPEHLDLYMGMREDTRRHLGAINEAITSNNDQIKLLENQLALARENGVVAADHKSELTALRDEYRRLSLQFKPDYPDLVVLKEKIDLLAQGSAGKGLPGQESDAQRGIRNQISTLVDKRKYLEDERATASSKLDDLEQRIIRIPQVEREFTEINRNYQTIQEQFTSLQAKAQSAALAESLEQQRKAERFSLLEPPDHPARAFKPDRKKLLILSIALSIGMPVGLVVLVGVLDKSIRSGEALTAVVGIPPLVEIPYIATQNELMAKRNHLIYGTVSVFAVIVLGLAMVNFLVMPLDIFASKVVARFGV